MLLLSPDFPVNPKKIPFYYGWLLVPMAVIGIIMTLPGQTAGFSAFTEPMLGLSGLSRTKLSLTYMTGTIISGFILPIMGRFLDRWGARLFMIFSSAMLGMVLLFMRNIDKIGMFIIKNFPGISVSAAYIMLLIPGLFGLRFFGQGLMNMTANTMIARWFSKTRGRAAAIVGMFNSLAFASAPAVLNKLVGISGWKGAWTILGLIIGAGMSVLAWIFYRDSPEICGIHVDADENTKTMEITGDDLKTASKTTAFRTIIATLAIHACVYTGLTFHIQAFGIQAGMSVDKAVAIFIPISFISVPLSFFGAWLSDRIRIKYLVMLQIGGQIFGFIFLFFFNSSAGYICSIIGLGISAGMFGPLYATAMPAYFGRLHLGAINGVLSSVTVIASALGPVFLSTINDVFGSLRFAPAVAVILPVAVFFGAIRMEDQPPR